MAIKGNCALCGEEGYNTNLKQYSCRKCRNLYDLDTEWARELINAERYWRKLNTQEDRKNILTFSDIEIYKNGSLHNGWDMLDGEIAFTGKNIEPVAHSSSAYKYVNYSDEIIIAMDWCKSAVLTQGEINAVLVRIQHNLNGKTNSTESAELLSKREGKAISPIAYRRRLSDARKKIKEYLASINQRKASSLSNG